VKTDSDMVCSSKDRPAKSFYPTHQGKFIMRHYVSLRYLLCFAVTTAIFVSLNSVESVTAAEKLNSPPSGFTALFNGKNLDGWKGLVGSPKSRAKMSAEDLAKAQKEADARIHQHWKVVDGVLVFDGKGKNLCTKKLYGNFEFYVDWKIKAKGDSGIYLRGSPQVQIWDPALSKQNAVGSGGLYNNKKNPSKPLVIADNPVGQWNTFYIKMVGERVTVKLNGKLVVDNTILENYWERDKPIYPKESIELQNHGNTLYFRNIYVKELP
jgi:hypothetical protein